MATNVIVYGASPRVPVDSCVGAHGSGDLVAEAGKFGIAVETNAVGQPNTLIERGLVLLPVPTGVAVGDKLYQTSATHSDGTTIQAAPQRAAAVTSVLDKTSTTHLLIGTAVTAAYADGLTTVAKVELAPQ